MAARVSAPMMTVAVVSAAKRPRSTCKRGCGVDSTNSSRPSSSSAAHRLACVTAKAINSSGRKTKRKLKMVALVAWSLPPTLVITSFRSGEPCTRAIRFVSVCLTTTTIHPANPAMPSVHQKVEPQSSPGCAYRPSAATRLPPAARAQVGSARSGRRNQRGMATVPPTSRRTKSQMAAPLRMILKASRTSMAPALVP